MENSKKPTYGQDRIRVSFNPSNNPKVDSIKNKSADLIDDLQEVKELLNKHMASQVVANAEQLANIVGTDKLDEMSQVFDIIRNIDIAQERIEEAAMWGVKALTSKNINNFLKQ